MIARFGLVPRRAGAQCFAAPQLAQQYVTSAAACEQREQIAHLVRGVARLIAQVHVNL